MEECMRKLALWHTRTFSPINSHQELEPILATLGFLGLPPSSSFKEYAYTAKPPNYDKINPEADQSPLLPRRPRLPYPNIDGLHIYTYQAFIDAVNFYLEMSDISELFHIRGMPLHRIVDRNRKWRRMEEDESVFVYREGTLDQTTYHLYHLDSKSSSSSSNDGDGSMIIRDKKGRSSASITIVPLKDIMIVV